MMTDNIPGDDDFTPDDEWFFDDRLEDNDTIERKRPELEVIVDGDSERIVVMPDGVKERYERLAQTDPQLHEQLGSAAALAEYEAHLLHQPIPEFSPEEYHDST